ncbi:GAF domain-containing protein [Kamptonema formosum]|uniref:GAF domain-containing protein n=1 Tax=Kamptonema formosum TaxID=331992 RepID=UPI00037C0B86|nr:GAF domain-containing protein [Oscillatoria sp. PCC 10802]
MVSAQSLFHRLSSAFAFPNEVQLSQIRVPDKQSALLRKIIDRIRNSLEMKVVLQTAVDEVATLLKVDRCCFLWYFNDSQRVQVVCERTCGNQKPSQLGYYPLENFGSAATAIAEGALIVNYGPHSNPQGVGAIARLMSRLPVRPLTAPQPSPRSQCQTPPHLLGALANLLVPVKNQGGWTGFIACLCDRPRQWTAGEIEFLQSIAQQLEIAIRQAQLYEQTEKQAQRERLINQITAQTRQSLNLETILNSAIAGLVEALKAERCLVHLVEDGDSCSHAQPLWEDGLEAAACQMAFRRRHLLEVCRDTCSPSIDDFDTHGPITQWVVEHRQMVVISDVTKDPRIGPNNPEYLKASIKSSLVVPVCAGDELQAILYINQCFYTRYWSKNDQKLAQSVADQLAISIQQAKLYSRAKAAAAKATAQAVQLTQLLHDLKQSQMQLIQTEKMSALGELVAGVAHEINNPVNFIYGNLNYADNYIRELLDLVRLYEKHYPHPVPEIEAHCEIIDLDFLSEDLPKLLSSMKIGAERIREIVLSLRNFSRVDQAEMKPVNLHEGIDSTLLILQNRLKPNGSRPGIAIVKEYGNLPPVECYAGQINQVFMNIISNAIDALEEANGASGLERHKNKKSPVTHAASPIPTIRIRTEVKHPNSVTVRISDNGPGMSESVKARLFNPFFTTKPVGKGTGLGLSISYQIVADKHGGCLTCHSQPGQGTEFCIEIPLRPNFRHCAPAVAPSSAVPAPAAVASC